VSKAILSVATDTEAGLVAMAIHGFGGLARVSDGSMAAGVLQAADILILLIRSGSDPQGAAG
jgi:nucleotide-binding universal stress UspA family protein